MQASSPSPLIQGKMVPLGPQGGQQVVIFWGCGYAELGHKEWVIHACFMVRHADGGGTRGQAVGGELLCVLLF